MARAGSERAKHIERHKRLHQALDELVADFIMHHRWAPGMDRPKLPSNTRVLELMQWSHQQTVDPDEVHD